MLADVLLQVLQLFPLMFPSLHVLRSHWLVTALIGGQNKFNATGFGLTDWTYLRRLPHIAFTHSVVA